MYTRNYVQEGGAIQLGKSDVSREDEKAGGALVKWTDSEDIGIALFEKFPGDRPADGAVYRPAREGDGARRLRRRPEDLERAEARGYPDGLVRRMEGKPVGVERSSQPTCPTGGSAQRRCFCSAWHRPPGRLPSPQRLGVRGSAEARRQPSRRRPSTSAACRSTCRRIQRQLPAVDRPRRTATACNLRYIVDVYGQAPRIELFTNGTTSLTGPAPYGAPTHSEMLEIITPQEHRAPAADFGNLFRWLADKAKDK